MRQKSVPGKAPATRVVKNIRRATRRHLSAEDKIRIVLEALRSEDGKMDSSTEPNDLELFGGRSPRDGKSRR